MISRLILTFLPLTLPAYVVRFQIGPLPTTLLELFILLSLISWVSVRGREGLRSAYAMLTARGWHGPLLAWLLTGLLGTLIAPDHLGAFGLWRAYFLEPALVFVMLLDLLRTPEDHKRLFRSFILALGGMAVIALVQFLTHWGIPHPWDKPPSGIRATGPFPFPNALALFSVPVAALCFHALIHPTRLPLSRAWTTFGFASGLLATLLAKSDGGLIALAAAAFVSLVLHPRWRLRAAAAALLIVIGVLVFPPARQIAADQLLFREWSGKVRLVMWKETRAMLKDHPLFGVGLGSYPAGIKPYHTATWMEIFQYPHNIVLNLWSEIGLLGIIAFSWICWTWVRRQGAMTLPLLVALLVHGLVDVPYFKNDLSVAFWLLVLLTMSIDDPAKLT